MSVFTNLSKNSAVFTTPTKPSGATIYTGTPIGLLLALTYAADINGATTWTQGSKNTSIFTNLTKS